MQILKKTNFIHLLSIVVIIVLTSFGVYFFLKHSLTHFIYSPMWNISFGCAIFAINIAILTKGFIEYKKTNDKRMALIACGFFTAGLFEIMHFLHSFEGSFQFIYSSLTSFCYVSAGFSSLFYLNKPYEEKEKKSFFTKTFVFYLIFFAAATFLTESLITHELANRFFTLSGTEMIWVASFFLISLIYTDIRKFIGINPFSYFSLGYLFLFLNKIYVPNSVFFTADYRFLIHIYTILGLFFIFTGIKDIQITTTTYDTKLKSFIPPYLFLIAIYILILLLSSDAFNVSMPEYIQYYFLVFFMLLMFSELKS